MAWADRQDNALLKAIDAEAAGAAEANNCDGKFLDGPFSATAWHNRKSGVWSVCVLTGIRCTLLAKSFAALTALYRKLKERESEGYAKWRPYYRAMWERRYRKWCCRKPGPCSCQLCRMEGTDRVKGKIIHGT